jgi:hypothetical protein
MRAKFLSTEGEYLEATVLINGVEYCIMDEVSLCQSSSPKVGDEFELEFQTELGDESWEEIFSGNPDKLKGLECVGGWKYNAYGQIVSTNPVCVDCGVLIEEDVIHTNDPKVIGEYISFTIERLGAYGYAI